MQSDRLFEIVKLDVGGSLYTTSRSTLISLPNNMLCNMFSGRIPSARDASGAYFIDRDGPTFRHVLNFLRQGQLILPDDFKDWDLLANEASFYQITELLNALPLLRQERRERAEAEAEARAKADSMRELEFIEISTPLTDSTKDGTYTFRGSPETLQEISLLFNFYIHQDFHIGEEYLVLEALERDTVITDKREYAVWDESCLDRMKLFQEVTSRGFHLLSTTSTEQTGTWLFGREVKFK